MKFSELQQQLKKEFGIDHLADIARELDVSPQAVSNWKARDRVPYKYVLKIRKQLEESDILGSEQSETNDSDSNKISTQYNYPQYIEKDTISLTDILLVLANQLKIIIITPAILCTITIFYVLFIAQPVYESTAKIMSSGGGGSSFQSSRSLAAQFGINIPSKNSEPQWVYRDIIKSRTLARTMLKRKFDSSEYGMEKSLFQILTSNKNEKLGYGQDTLEFFAINTLIDMIELEEDAKSQVYTIKVSANKPQFAADLLTAVIEELDAHQWEYNNKKISETRQFVEERIHETEKELNTAEEALKDFHDHNRRIQNSPALLLEQQRLSREVAVLTGVFTTLKQKLETVKIEEVKESDYVVVLDPPESPLFRSKPRKKSMVIMTGLLGIILGIILALMKDHFDNNKEKINRIKTLALKNIGKFSLFKKLMNGKKRLFHI